MRYYITDRNSQEKFFFDALQPGIIPKTIHGTAIGVISSVERYKMETYVTLSGSRKAYRINDMLDRTKLRM